PKGQLHLPHDLTLQNLERRVRVGKIESLDEPLHVRRKIIDRTNHVEHVSRSLVHEVRTKVVCISHKLVHVGRQRLKLDLDFVEACSDDLKITNGSPLFEPFDDAV